MNELISKKSFLKHIQNWKEENKDDSKIYNLLQLIENGIINEPVVDNWIPCKEKLPEEDSQYKDKHIINCLVSTDKGLVTKVQRIHAKNCNGEYDHWYWGRIYGNVLAWQPLPEKYKDRN